MNLGGVKVVELLGFLEFLQLVANSRPEMDKLAEGIAKLQDISANLQELQARCLADYDQTHETRPTACIDYYYNYMNLNLLDSLGTL